jgi:hypothetical protein
VDVRGPGFTRTVKECLECHRRDFGTPRFNHVASNTGTDCRACHTPATFQTGELPGHDRCFLISSGAHGGVSCRGCHSTIPPALGTCSSGTETCTACHSCSSMSSRHATVPGYQCQDRKCYECHKNAGQR